MRLLKQTSGLLVLLAALLLTHVQESAAQLKVDGQLRTRTELNRGLGNLPVDGDDAVLYTSQRTRLRALYSNDNLKTMISLQDVRTWGGESIYSGTGVWGDSVGVGLHQAWAEYWFTERLGVKVGRQELNYDDGRILSWRNWNQNALAYDAALLKFEPEGWKVHLGLTYNAKAKPVFGDDSYYNDGTRFKTFNFLYAKREISEKLDLSLQGYSASYQSVSDDDEINTTYTAGAYGDYHADPLKLNAGAYYQFGENENGIDVSAYMATADGSYAFNPLSVSAGVTYIHGNDPGSDDYLTEDNTFDLMYGARHGYYGWMNHFTLIDRHTNRAGLIDFHPGVSYTFSPKAKLSATYLAFWLANDAQTTSGLVTDAYLGSELDASFTYKLSSYATATAGLSWFWAEDAMEQLRGIAPGESETTYWGWIMLRFNPTFFES